MLILSHLRTRRCLDATGAEGLLAARAVRPGFAAAECGKLVGLAVGAGKVDSCCTAVHEAGPGPTVSQYGLANARGKPNARRKANAREGPKAAARRSSARSRVIRSIRPSPRPPGPHAERQIRMAQAPGGSLAGTA